MFDGGTVGEPADAKCSDRRLRSAVGTQTVGRHEHPFTCVGAADVGLSQPGSRRSVLFADLS